MAVPSPVSYTHLDVYKRQVLYLAVIFETRNTQTHARVCDHTNLRPQHKRGYSNRQHGQPQVTMK